MTKYILPLLAALVVGCGDKDDDTGSEDTAVAPGDTADSGDSGEAPEDTGSAE